MRTLSRIYADFKLDNNKLVALERKIREATRCPCKPDFCYHNISGKRRNCGKCPLSDIWREMRREISRILDKYFWGIK